MSDFNFVVKNVFPGTEKQVNVGIYATFTIDIVVNDGILATLSNMKLCKQREKDVYYIQSEFREYTTTNKDTGQQEKKRGHFVRLWPEKENWSKQDPIVEQVRAELANRQSNQGQSSRPSNPTPQPTQSNRGGGTPVW